MAQFMRGVPGIAILVILILCLLSAVFVVFSFLPTFIPSIQIPEGLQEYIPLAIIVTIFVVFGAIYFIGTSHKNHGDL